MPSSVLGLHFGLAGGHVSEEQLSVVVDEETYALDKELAGDRVLAVHEVADQDEQHDEDIEQQRRLEEEVVAEDQKGLHAISASNGPDDPGGAWVVSHGV